MVFRLHEPNDVSLVCAVRFIPLLLGLLAGASGAFLIIYSLITHFCKTEEAAKG